jgi:antitoxin PrlF
MRPIEETSTITATGQTTVPKAVRQALGVDYGGKIAFRIERGRVTVHNPEAEHRDPALGAFLELMEKDIAAGRHIRDLPAELAVAMRHAIRHVEVDLNAPLESPDTAGRGSVLANVADGLGHYMLAHQNAHYRDVAVALGVAPEAVELPVKYWKQVTAFLSELGQLRIANSDLATGAVGKGKRPKVWRHMQANPTARPVDVAQAVGLTPGAVDKPVKYWKQITAFLAEQGLLRTR